MRRIGTGATVLGPQQAANLTHGKTKGGKTKGTFMAI
jgi:hypothetical protein